MSLLLRIAERALNRPLLIHPDKIPLILGVVQGRIPLGDVSGWKQEAEERIDALPAEAQAVMRGPAPNASRFVGSSIDEDPMTGVKTQLPYRRTREGVALISVIGTLINRGAWVGSYSGETSYEGLKFQITRAAEDPRAAAILLDIESPGGEAIGAFEVAEMVRDAAAKKPLTAVVNGMAASAAYAIASGARQIVTTETGISGSIGVVMLHADFSRALDKAGITPTLIFAGAHKVDGNPFEPLPEGVRDDLMREVNHFYDLFVQTVANGRRQMSAAAIRGTEARVFIGSEAVSAGLADSVGTFETALADLTRSIQSRTASPSGSMKGTRMTETQTAPAGEAGITKADHDSAVAKARADGKAEGVTEGKTLGASEERARIEAIRAAAFEGQDALVKECVDAGLSVGEAALKLNADHKAKGVHLEAIKAAERHVAGLGAAPSVGADAGGGKPPANTDDGWKAEYQASAALKAEFATEADYAAFKKREAAGQVRILKGRAAA